MDFVSTEPASRPWKPEHQPRCERHRDGVVSYLLYAIALISDGSTSVSCQCDDPRGMRTTKEPYSAVFCAYRGEEWDRILTCLTATHSNGAQNGSPVVCLETNP